MIELTDKQIKGLLSIKDSIDAYASEIEDVRLSLQSKIDKIEERIDKYDMKDSLTERQEEIYDDLESKQSDIQDILDELEDCASHLEDASMNIHSLTVLPQIIKDKVDKMHL